MLAVLGEVSVLLIGGIDELIDGGLQAFDLADAFRGLAIELNVVLLVVVLVGLGEHLGAARQMPTVVNIKVIGSPV